MKKIKRTLYLLFKVVLLSIAVIILVVSSTKLYNYNMDKEASEKMAESVVSNNTESSHAPVKVDFEKLKEENNDIIAWIYCEGTPINYPVVLAKDNSYYLHRQANGEYGFAGTLFADYRNKADFSDNNTIIYGHNMKNDTMFGTIDKYKNQEYYNKYPEMYLLTPERDYKIEIVAGITENSRSDIYNLPLSVENKMDFILSSIEKSTFKTEYNFHNNDRFITLSTCSYNYEDARCLVIGVIREL